MLVIEGEDIANVVFDRLEMNVSDELSFLLEPLPDLRIPADEWERIQKIFGRDTIVAAPTRRF